MQNTYQGQNGLTTTLSNSPKSVTVYPGQIDPTKSYTNLSGSPLTQASVAFNFVKSFVDLWDNLHYQTLSDDIAAGMVVTITADYINHDNYPSPVSVPDLSGWQSTYGTSLTGTSADNNDGTMTGTLTVMRAGSYRLTIQIDGVNIIGSPFTHLEVEPFTLVAA